MNQLLGLVLVLGAVVASISAYRVYDEGRVVAFPLGQSTTPQLEDPHQVGGHPQLRPRPLIMPKIDQFPNDGKRFKRQHDNVQVDVQHNHERGSDVSVDANKRLYTGNDGRTQVDANANFNQHFGGQQGRTRPDFGAGIRFRHDF